MEVLVNQMGNVAWQLNNISLNSTGDWATLLSWYWGEWGEMPPSFPTLHGAAAATSSGTTSLWTWILSKSCDPLLSELGYSVSDVILTWAHMMSHESHDHPVFCFIHMHVVPHRSTNAGHSLCLSWEGHYCTGRNCKLSCHCCVCMHMYTYVHTTLMYIHLFPCHMWNWVLEITRDY